MRDGEDEQRGRKRVVRDESDEEEMDMEEEESGDGEESGAAGRECSVFLSRLDFPRSLSFR